MGKALQWDGGTMGRGHNETQRDGEGSTMGRGHNGTGTQWDRKGWGRLYKGTGAPWDGDTMGQKGTGMAPQWHRGTMDGPLVVEERSSGFAPVLRLLSFFLLLRLLFRFSFF